MDQEDIGGLITSLGYKIQEIETRLHVLEADLGRVRNDLDKRGEELDKVGQRLQEVENDLEEFSTSVVLNTPIGSTSHSNRTKDSKDTRETNEVWWVCKGCGCKIAPIADIFPIRTILDARPDRRTDAGNYYSAKPCSLCELPVV